MTHAEMKIAVLQNLIETFIASQFVLTESDAVTLITNLLESSWYDGKEPEEKEFVKAAIRLIEWNQREGD